METDSSVKIPDSQGLFTGVFNPPSPALSSVLKPRAMTPLQKRIHDRLSSLGLSANAAGKRVGNPEIFRQALRIGAPKHPRTDTLRKMAEALEVSETWLLTGTETDVTAEPLDETLHRRAVQAALQSLETAGLELSADKLADLISLLYRQMVEIQNKPGGKK